MIPKDTIDEIFNRAYIEEVVSDFVSLKKRGSNFMGLCPFHNEKTPSFTVSPAKGIYKCFGCGKGGNSVNFVMEHEHATYPEALKYLAKKYSIDVQEEEQSPEQVQAANERESLHLINAFAAQYFVNSMTLTEEGKSVGLSYYKERGYRTDTIEKFMLGYSPEKEKSLTKTALDKAYKINYLLQLGLSKNGHSGYFDFFKGRVIFPIRNLSGRVVGFGGRILSSEKKIAKYFNSPESIVYNKSKILYGLFESKKRIVEKDTVYLVEGYTDVISMHQGGVENVVSSSGTSLTEDQIRLVRRYTKNIVVVFDGDAAGLNAAFRGIDMLLEEDMKVKVIALAEGDDPDTLAQRLTQEELQNYLDENAKDYFSFKTKILLKLSGDDPAKRSNAIRDVIKTLALIPDKIELNLQSLTLSRELNINQETLLYEINKQLQKKTNDKYKQSRYNHMSVVEPKMVAPKQKTSVHNPTENQECDLVRILLNHGTKAYTFEVEDENGEVTKEDSYVALYIIEELLSNKLAFRNVIYQSILEKYVFHYHQNELMTAEMLMRDNNPEISNVVASLTSEKHDLGNWEKHGIFIETEDLQLKRMLESSINSFKLRRVSELIKQNQLKLKDETDDQEWKKCLKKQKQLEGLKKELSSYFGSTII
ncbi:MAG: DNA primase [Patiriisocius sp.]|jgi:DNA primase